MPRVTIIVTLLSVVCGDFSFVAIGDWGGENDELPVTDSQKATAAGMMRIAKDMGAEFALMMGDNYYYHGVNCPADVSPRFAKTFENVYAKLLPGGTFYAIAGNHDYGEGRLSNISAQLAYNDISPSWNFPSLWYSLRQSFMAGGQERTLKVILIDTVVLCGNGEENEKFIDAQLEFLGQAADPARPGHLRTVIAERQWSWLERELDEAGDTDYLWISGHYPIWSAGVDGSIQCLIDRLLPLLKEHNAQYISGHDHNLEHIVTGDTNMFVVGAGKECCYNPVNIETVPRGALRFMAAGFQGQLSQPPLKEPVYGGFASLKFGAEFTTVTLHAHTGEVIYTAAEIPRRGAVSRLSVRAHACVIAIGLAASCGLALCVFVGARFRQRRGVCKEYILLES